MNGCQLRVYVSESDRAGQRPLFEELVLQARDLGLAGATVYRAPLGFGSRHTLHQEKILQLSMDLPVVVECVDAPGRIDAYLQAVAELTRGHLVTLCTVEMRGVGA